MEKLTNQQFKFVCELIWGGVPVDRKLAEESPLFKQKAPEILEMYPMLDKSFFEKNKDHKNRKVLSTDTDSRNIESVDLKDYHIIKTK